MVQASFDKDSSPRDGPVRPARRSIRDVAALKAEGKKIVMLAVYDASFAATAEAEGVDSLLVGDSLGMVVQGFPTTHAVTLDHIAYHTQLVVRGSASAFVIADMPFGSYHEGPEQAMRNAARLIGAGAQMVKLEGGTPFLSVIRYLADRGVPVCGHTGLTPQAIHQLGGFRVQGRSEEAADRLHGEALAIQSAGASMIVLEAIPAALAGRITKSLALPTIGIGAGADCAGQVLVSYDIIGLHAEQRPRFVQNFGAESRGVADAFRAYVKAVRDGSFPGEEHAYAAAPVGKFVRAPA